MVDVLLGDALKAFCDNPNSMFKQLEATFDSTVERHVAAERERCIGICRYVLREDLAGLCIGHIESGKPLAAIRKGE